MQRNILFRVCAPWFVLAITGCSEAPEETTSVLLGQTLADEVLDRESTTRYPATHFFSSYAPAAQTFTAGRSGRLTRAAFYADVCYPDWEQSFGISCGFTLRLSRISSGGSPGQLIAETRARAPMPPLDGYPAAWTEATFPSRPQLSAGGRYVLELVPDFSMRAPLGSGHPGGDFLYWDRYPGFWQRAAGDIDLLFRTWVIEGSALPCGATVRLRSWKGDYLHRPDSPQGVTTWSHGDWGVECSGSTVRLRSWKGDYLHRPDGPASVTTWNTGIGNEWTVESAGERTLLRSWKGDYLKRPDGPQDVTSGPSDATTDWTVEVLP
jgi:hypothetical protein